LARLVVRLSPMAKVGCLLAVVGAALGIWHKLGGPDWANKASWPLVLLGSVLYFIARARAIMKSRKL